MNTKVITLMLFGLIFFNLSAQNENPTFRLGLHFSPNISWLDMNTTNYESDGTKIGFSYGISTEFFLAKNYLFSTGFSINNVGGKMKYEGTYDNVGVLSASSIKENIKINYIDFPLSLKLRTNEIGYMTYYGNFGFIAGIKYSSKTTYEYVDLKNIKQTDLNNTSNISFLNMNLIVGAGAEYNLGGNTNIMFGFTYHNGFMNVLNSKTPLLDSNGKATIASGKAVYTDKDVSSSLSYISLDLGIYF